MLVFKIYRNCQGLVIVLAQVTEGGAHSLQIGGAAPSVIRFLALILT